MRYLLLFASLLIPRLLFAQFDAGYYVLTQEPTVRHSVRIKMQNENTLVIKDGNKKKQELDLAQVAFYRIGEKTYRPIGGFSIKKGRENITRGFAEVLDSGQVMLYAYSYRIASGPMMSGNGTMYGGGSSWQTIYLVENAGQQNLTTISASALTGTSKEFREALRPFLAPRADLVKHLDEKRLLIYHLQSAVQALNHGEAFIPVDPWRATTQ
ncbi:hypothetical protein KLP40_11435 [Hymenobacter sp. NST-14]|uniref:hypothetical protein n=1 Tax=Hymenobacter piscis TaxID=2839984 RepID=UPI001C01CFF2|nr:hypothetical protein [Hymenobacter piscis]MBT9393776.1 hypothetical protein [Hymenobacter piscis]